MEPPYFEWGAVRGLAFRLQDYRVPCQFCFGDGAPFEFKFSDY